MKFTLSLFLITWLAGPIHGQLSSLSPPSSLTQVVGNTTISIDFERPAARGRKVFGNLVPWGKVWRTGAGYCTKIGFSRQVSVGDQPVPAGKYALLTIPGREEWIIILNRDTTLYGSRDYDATKDLIRFRAPTQATGRHFESLSLDLDISPDNARLFISWADVQVSFPIETTTEYEAFAYIDGLMEAPLTQGADYAWPADFLLFKRANLNQALALADRQLKLGDNESARRIKAHIYDYLGLPEKALAEIDSAMALVNRTYGDKPEQLAPTLAYWRSLRAKVEQKTE